MRELLRRYWRTLTTPSKFYSLGFLTIGGFIGGVLFWGGFNTAMEFTNTEQFCVSCHEMRDNVYQEIQPTIHFTNRSGVRAICSDCHVPREPGPMLWRKVLATFEIWGKLTGVIDTKEKFEAHRYELAKRVWSRMKATDSLECRNCHHENAWNPESQSERAKGRHAKAKAEGMTCIDCHFGIAHKEPEGGPGPQELKLGK